MLTKTQMQQIQDLKLMGYTKTDIIRYYEAHGEKRGRKIFCVYGKNSSLIRNRYV